MTDSSEDPFLISTAAKPREGEAVAECGRRCIATPPCRSFALNPERRRCILSALDLCSKPAVLQTAKGELAEERRKEERIRLPA